MAAAGQLLSFFNSNFFSAAFGALAGAFAATWLARRNEKQRRLLDEIAACNVAIGQCAAIANVFVAIKRQRVKPMHDYYLAQWQSVLQAVFAILPPMKVEVRFDLQTLTPAWTSIDALNEILTDRILSAFEPAAVGASLTQAIRNQRHVTDMRNELVEKFRACPDAEKMARYFGTTLPSGHTDRSYPDLMIALSMYTDDCIYFSALLADVLNAHGGSIATELGTSSPKVKRMDFSSVERDGLMPDRKEYSEFEQQYRPKKKPVVPATVYDIWRKEWAEIDAG